MLAGEAVPNVEEAIREVGPFDTGPTVPYACPASISSQARLQWHEPNDRHSPGSTDRRDGAALLRADGELHLLRAIREIAVLRRRIATTDVRMQVAAPTAPVELWADLHARLRAFVGRRVADPHAADDIAQEVLLRLHRSLGDLRAQDRLDAFAYRIARNAIIDHYRAGAAAKETPTAPDVVTAGLDHAVTSEDAQEAQAREQLARCLEPLVARLSEPYRQALTLTDLGDLSQVEAAQRVGLSVPGMKARVQRARVQIRDLLTECCRVTLNESRHIADVERAGPCACTPD